MTDSSSTPPRQILSAYCATPAETISRLGEGNINDTYLVRSRNHSFVLQRINGDVFPDPDILIENLRLLSAHLQSRRADSREQWEELRLLPTLHGTFAQRDKRGALWRAISYIENSCTLSCIETARQAEQVGEALGYFHKRVADLDSEKMQIPLPGFHQTRIYLQQYDQLGDVPLKSSAATSFCRESIARERAGMTILEDALDRNSIRQRVVHGDPKVGNILFDKTGKESIAIIDLDTIGPGLLQHDIGDCLRSVCNLKNRENTPEKSVFDLELCKNVLRGYFQEAGNGLALSERNFIFEGLTTITFELGLRFFTDFLQGGIYFKNLNVEEILSRAVAQFVLLQSIFKQEQSIRRLIRG